MTINKEGLDQEPTEEQMQKLFEAWKKDGKMGLAKAIHENELKVKEKGPKKK